MCLRCDRQRSSSQPEPSTLRSSKSLLASSVLNVHIENLLGFPARTAWVQLTRAVLVMNVRRETRTLVS